MNMKNYPYITTKQLQYFISVAENLSFTKAAAENFVAQTAISQSILTLEQELDVVLFTRTKRKVSLTKAGLSFYLDAKKMLENLENCVAKARHTQEGFSDFLKIGFQGVHERDILPRILHVMKDRHPQISIELTQKPLYRLAELLEQKKLDCIFSLAPDIRTSNDIQEYVYAHEKLCAVLPVDHPLADREVVTRNMFASDPVIFVKPENSAGTYDDMLHDCIKAGFVPNIATITDNIESTLMLVNAGVGVSFLPKCCRIDFRGVVFIELENEESLDLNIRWHKDNDNPALASFLEEMKNLPDE